MALSQHAKAPYEFLLEPLRSKDFETEDIRRIATALDVAATSPINAKLWGAKGNWNGSYGDDDTNALQDAIDSAVETEANYHSEYATSGALYLPPGAYKISSPLVIPRGFMIFGAGKDQSIIVNQNDGNAIETETGTYATRRITLRDFQILGLSRDVATQGSAIHLECLTGNRAGSFHIENVWIYGGYNGISFHDSYGPSDITNVRADYIGGKGIQTLVPTGGIYPGFGTGVVFNAVYINQAYDHAFYVQLNYADFLGCAANNIGKWTLSGSTRTGVLQYSDGWHFFRNPVVDGWSSTVSLIGCNYEASSGRAVYGDYLRDTQFIGCYFSPTVFPYEGTHGIELKHGRNITLVGSRVTSYEGYAIYTHDNTQGLVIINSPINTTNTVVHYFSDAASGVGAYYEAYRVAQTGAEFTFTAPGLTTGDDQLLISWIAPTASPACALVPPGSMSGHVHAEKTAGTRDVTLYWTLVERKADTSETLILTSVDSASLADALSTTVDADSAAGQKVLNVASTTGFSPADVVWINVDGARQESATIDTVQAGISLTMTTNLTYTHTAAQADIVRPEHAVTMAGTLAAEYALAATTSRLVFKLYANVGAAGTNVNVAVYAEGLSNSRITLPVFTDFNEAEIMTSIGCADHPLASVGIGTNIIAGDAALSVNGGVHVGGRIDPGDDNLEVEGSSLLNGPLCVGDEAALGGMYDGQLYASTNGTSHRLTRWEQHVTADLNAIITVLTMRRHSTLGQMQAGYGQRFLARARDLDEVENNVGAIDFMKGTDDDDGAISLKVGIGGTLTQRLLLEEGGNTINGASNTITGALNLGTSTGAATGQVKASGGILGDLSSLVSTRGATTDAALIADVTGDNLRRYVVYADGKTEWGTGAVARDTNLYRSAADTLKTDDAFVSASTLTGTQLVSTVAIGTAPLGVTSTTVVPNLNADMVDGLHAADMAGAAHTHTHASTTGQTANDHHNQAHAIDGADHTIAGAALNLVGASALNTLGQITPSADVSAATSAVLKSDANGQLILARLGVADTPAALGQIFAKSATYPPLQGNRTSAATNTTLGGVQAKHTTTDNMADGFGAVIGFAIEDSAAVSNVIGTAGFVRAGADNTGDFVVRPYTAGTANERMRLTAAGRLGIMDAAPAEVLDVTGNANVTGVYKVDDVQVVGNQGAAVADATDAASVILRLNDLLARVRAHGLIAT